MVLRQDAAVEEQSVCIKKVVLLNNELQWGEANAQQGVQETTEMRGKLEWLKAKRAIAALRSRPRVCGEARKNRVLRVDIETRTGQWSTKVGQLLANCQWLVWRPKRRLRLGAKKKNFVCSDRNINMTIGLISLTREEVERD